MQAEFTASPTGIQQQASESHPMLRRLLRFNPEFNLNRVGSPAREEVEQHIAGVFAKTYDAEVTEFAPFLMSMVCVGNVSAAAGVRPAVTGPLFLEKYLDEPVEQLLSKRYDDTIERREIFELGNLAAMRSGVCQLFYLILAGVIARTDLNYVMFAGTPLVAKGLKKLGFQLDSIVAADPARIGDAAASWGTYYESQPTVMVINLRESMAVVGQLPLPRMLLSIFEPQITELANHFKSAYR